MIIHIYITLSVNLCMVVYRCNVYPYFACVWYNCTILGTNLTNLMSWHVPGSSGSFSLCMRLWAMNFPSEKIGFTLYHLVIQQFAMEKSPFEWFNWPLNHVPGHFPEPKKCRKKHAEKMQQTARLDQPNDYLRNSAPHRPRHHFLVTLLQKLLLKKFVENLDASPPQKNMVFQLGF